MKNQQFLTVLAVAGLFLLMIVAIPCITPVMEKVGTHTHLWFWDISYVDFTYSIESSMFNIGVISVSVVIGSVIVNRSNQFGATFAALLILTILLFIMSVCVVEVLQLVFHVESRVAETIGMFLQLIVGNHYFTSKKHTVSFLTS